MKKVLVLGAGLSASTLIKYLLEHAENEQWTIKVGDIDLDTAKRKIGSNPYGEAFCFDINNQSQIHAEIPQADLVISMLPASMHGDVARACVHYGKHMVTASYVSDEMNALHQQACEKNIILLNECGVDPGIDHMSAMAVIDKIHAKGGILSAFGSYCGGLVSPENDNNPWNYKFTWNPRNVVVAGQGSAAKYILNNEYKYVPYQNLFTHTERVEILDGGEFEVYPNRDSLKYRSIYGLETIPTMIRGTMRRPGYSKAWNMFVKLGLTEDTYTIENSEHITYAEFLSAYLPGNGTENLENRLAEFLKIPVDSPDLYKLRWLGIFKHHKIGLRAATPAQILQHLLIQKWKLSPNDKDMIAMQHIFDYELNGNPYQTKSSMLFIGQDTTHTAMSMTVGLPVAIAARLILRGELTNIGVNIPTKKEIYVPILKELESYGVKFIEEEVEKLV